MSASRRPMRRAGEVLPAVASALGLDEELRRARQIAIWQRLVAELVPGAGGHSTLLDIQPPVLLVSASSAIVAQELRLRQAELLAAFGHSPEGVRLLELRVAVRTPGGREST